MKELSIEKKAKRYDEVVNKLRHFITQGVDPLITRADVQDFFPELKEPEDERIRKELLAWLKSTDGQTLPIDRYNAAIAWLEKRGESIDINPSEFDLRLNKLLKQFETLPKEELVSSLSFYLNVVQNDGTYKDEEEQDGQKPTDEEMKTLLRTEYEKIRESLLEYLHTLPNHYTHGGVCVLEWIAWLEKQGFQKPTDEEMKELLRTEYEKGRADAIAEIQKLAWSEEDETIADNLAWAIANDKIRPQDRDDYCDWLKYLKDRVGCEANCTTTKEWSEEDESYLNTTIAYLKDAKEFKKTAENCINWLKSLKDRVQPQQEWSEDAERIYKSVLYAFEHNYPLTVQQQKFVKSLRERYTWKPSNGQMKALEHFVRSIGESGYASPYENNTKLLYSLLEQLKKLKA